MIVGYAAPTGLDIFGFWFYKDSAPTELTDENPNRNP